MIDEQEALDALDGVVEDEESPNTAEPTRNSPEWTDYVFSLLKEGKELFTENQDGRELKVPSASGLRRIFPILVGNIINCLVDMLQGPNFTGKTIKTPDGKIRNVYNPVVCKCTLEYFDRQDGVMKVYSDVATVSIDNCKYPYANHPAESAATKAESRVLRKVLGLNCITREELSDGSNYIYDKEDENDVIGVAGITVLQKWCQQLGIEHKYVIKHYLPEYASSNKQYEIPKYKFNPIRERVLSWLDGSTIPEQIKNGKV